MGGFLPFVMKPTPPSARGIGRKLLSIGINLPVSKFLNVPKPTLAASAVSACDPPKRNRVALSCGAKGRLFDFVVDASNERR